MTLSTISQQLAALEDSMTQDNASPIADAAGSGQLFYQVGGLLNQYDCTYPYCLQRTCSVNHAGLSESGLPGDQPLPSTSPAAAALQDGPAGLKNKQTVNAQHTASRSISRHLSVPGSAQPELSDAQPVALARGHTASEINPEAGQVALSSDADAAGEAVTTKAAIAESATDIVSHAAITASDTSTGRAALDTSTAASGTNTAAPADCGAGIAAAITAPETGIDISVTPSILADSSDQPSGAAERSVSDAQSAASLQQDAAGLWTANPLLQDQADSGGNQIVHQSSFRSRQSSEPVTRQSSTGSAASSPLQAAGLTLPSDAEAANQLVTTPSPAVRSAQGSSTLAFLHPCISGGSHCCGFS